MGVLLTGWCRPGRAAQRRDPGPMTTGLAVFPQSRDLWLWVPAFAGTTAECYVRITAQNAPVTEPVAPDGVNEITSSSLTSAASVELRSARNAPPGEPPVTDNAPEEIAAPPLIASATAAVPVTAPFCTQPTETMRPLRGTRTKAATGAAPSDAE